MQLFRKLEKKYKLRSEIEETCFIEDFCFALVNGAIFRGFHDVLEAKLDC